MEELSFLYFVILPFVMAAGIVEGLWQSRTRAERYDWKAWGCSLADLVGPPRRWRSFPTRLPRPGWAGCGEHRLFTQSLDNVWSVLLLFVGLEFFYYWYHRTSHTSRWFWTAHSVHHSPNQLNLAAAYRLGWFGKFTGTSLFFTPLVVPGLHADRRAVGPVPEPALPVLAARRLDPQARLAGIRASTRRRATASITRAIRNISTPTTAAC